MQSNYSPQIANSHQAVTLPFKRSLHLKDPYAKEQKACVDQRAANHFFFIHFHSSSFFQVISKASFTVDRWKGSADQETQDGLLSWKWFFFLLLCRFLICLFGVENMALDWKNLRKKVSGWWAQCSICTQGQASCSHLYSAQSTKKNQVENTQRNWGRGIASTSKTQKTRIIVKQDRNYTDKKQ